MSLKAGQALRGCKSCVDIPLKPCLLIQTSCQMRVGKRAEQSRSKNLVTASKCFRLERRRQSIYLRPGLK